MITTTEPRVSGLQVEVSFADAMGDWDKYAGTYVGTLLLDSDGLELFAVESVEVQGEVFASEGLQVGSVAMLDSAHQGLKSIIVFGPLSQLPGLPKLRSLVLRTESYSGAGMGHVTPILRNLQQPTLKEVTVEVYRYQEVSGLFGDGIEGLYENLEQALLRFPRPRMTWYFEIHHADRKSFWTYELGKRFPTLFERGALAAEPRLKRGEFWLISLHAMMDVSDPNTDSSLRAAGHDGDVAALVASPDSKWIASSSRDGTIILWNAHDGTIAWQWLAHPEYNGVTAHTFSPDSRYLVSGGGAEDGKVIVWDLVDSSNSPHATVLVGHADAITNCAWSPGGGVIASGSADEAVQLWDANTFRLLHILETAGPVQILKFSPNGRWLVSMCDCPPRNSPSAKSGTPRRESSTRRFQLRGLFGTWHRTMPPATEPKAYPLNSLPLSARWAPAS